MADGSGLFIVDVDAFEVPHRGRRGEQHRVDVGGDGVEGMGLGEVEGADPQAAQGTQVRAAAERRAQVSGEGPHVGAGAALHEDGDHRVRTGFEGLDVEAVDPHRAGRPLALLAAAGEVVQAATPDLEGADHRWDLLEVADEPAGDVFDLGLTDGHRLAVEDRAGGVEGARRDPEDDVAPVGLPGLGEESEQPRHAAQPDEQHTGGVGVEGAGVTDAPLPVDATQPGDDVMRRAPSRLVHHHESVAHGRPRARGRRGCARPSWGRRAGR